MQAYEDMLSHTSTKHAPWFVIPADDKWFARVCLSEIIVSKMEELKLAYPVVSEATKTALEGAKKELENN